MPLCQGNTQASPTPAAEGKYFWRFGNRTGKMDKIIPTTAPIAMDQTLTGAKASKPLLSAWATAPQVSAAGAGNWSVPSLEASGTSTREGQHGGDCADEDAGELGEELLARDAPRAGSRS